MREENVANGIRTGRVSSVNYKAGTYRVTYFDRGKSVTREINAASNGEYRMPEIGQVVSVLHAGNGSAAATSIGTIWNRSNRPAEGYKGLYRKEYAGTPGRAYERYDANTGAYVQVAGSMARRSGGDILDAADGDIGLEARGGVRIKADANGEAVIAGDLSLTVEGTLTVTVGATVITVGAGGVQIQTQSLDAGAQAGDVKIGTVSLREHIHEESGGARTKRPE